MDVSVRHSAADRLLHPFIFLSRLGLGWYLMSTGWAKLAGDLNSGLGTFYGGGSFQNRSAWMPEFVAVLFGYSWPWLETAFGLLVLVGLWGRMSAAVSAWILLSIGLALLFVGEFFPRHHIMVFFPMALMLWLLGPGRYSVDGWLSTRRS